MKVGSNRTSAETGDGETANANGGRGLIGRGPVGGGSKGSRAPRRLAGKGIAACAAAVLVAMTAVPAAYAQDDAGGEDPRGAEANSSESAAASADGTLIDRISEAAQEGADTPEALAAQISLPLEGAGSLTFDEDLRIVALVTFAGAPSDETLAAVREIAVLDEVYERFPAATARVDPSRLAELAEVPGVASAVPATEPVTSSGQGASAASVGGALPSADTPAGDACGPIEIEADGPLRSAEAREVFGVDGTGVTIGIISDSFAGSDRAITSWADDVASGALPGPGNPCGRTLPVEVLSDTTAADEGRAMAQLVHGIAPGARIVFARAGAHEVEMAMNIYELVEAGADVIVDDIGWLNELTYQQGYLAYAIADAREAGVAYLTAAGNSTGLGSQGASDGLPVSSWQTTAYRPMECPDWILSDVPGDDGSAGSDPLRGTSYDCLDFDPNPDDGVQTPYETLILKGERGGTPIKASVVGSVGEPLFGATTDYEWRYFEVDPETGEAEMIGYIPRTSPQHPNFYGGLELPAGGEVRAVMVRKSFEEGARLPAVYTMFMSGGGAVAERAHMGDGVRDWVGESTFGHAGDGSATSIGSLIYDEPDEIRPYSSLGPVTLLFDALDPNTNQPSARLSAPQIVSTPHLMGVDGTITTFFGNEEEGDDGAIEHRFYGTSAASPNVAAVAALAKSYAPELDQAELTRLLVDTAAADVVNPYAPRFEDEYVFGAGRADAVALLSALPERPVVAGLKLARAAADSLDVTWERGSADHYVIELYRGAVDPANAVEASQLEGSAVAYTFERLQPDTAYTVRITPYGEFGVTGASVPLEARTLAASGGSGGAGAAANGGSNGDANGSGTASGSAGATGQLSRTGAEGQLPLLIGAGALVLLGAAVAVGAAVRKRRATSDGGE